MRRIRRDVQSCMTQFLVQYGREGERKQIDTDFNQSEIFDIHEEEKKEPLRLYTRVEEEKN